MLFLDKHYPLAPNEEVPLSGENTLQWLVRANTAQQKGIVDAYTYLNYGRNSGLAKNDLNIVAAERFAEGYFGNFNKFLITGQHALKAAREIPGMSYILGKNGSPLSSSEFTGSWGILGVDIRNSYIKKHGTEPTEIDFSIFDEYINEIR